TLTVAVAREAFEQLLNREEDIVVPDNNARLTWLGYADRVIVDLIVPEMRRDIMRAWGAEEGNARRIYDMLLKELMNSSGRGPSERLKDVMKFYLEVNREPLVPANITEFLARAQERLLETGGKGFVDEPHPGLMEAIHEYLADQQSKIVPLTVIADSIAGIETDAASSEVREAFKKVMIHELGYASDRAIADAIATVDEVLSKKEELESR
ncbi:MAG TPA: hypothetical protein PLH57_11815, partial [Oligoflexia bacterium]|nr:hypothetical protein [Oligoflexia bacterium]